MPVTSCRYAGPNQPRVLPGRHEADCADPSTCGGCPDPTQACEDAHCRALGVTMGLNTSDVITGRQRGAHA